MSFCHNCILMRFRTYCVEKCALRMNNNNYYYYFYYYYYYYYYHHHHHHLDHIKKSVLTWAALSLSVPMYCSRTIHLFKSTNSKIAIHSIEMSKKMHRSELLGMSYQIPQKGNCTHHIHFIHRHEILDSK